MQKELAVALVDVAGEQLAYDPLQYTRYPLRRFSYASARHGCDALLSRVFVCHYVDTEPTIRADIEHLRSTWITRPFILITNRIHAETIRWATALRIHYLFAIPQELVDLHRMLDLLCDAGSQVADSHDRCEKYYTTVAVSKWRSQPAVAHMHQHYECRVCVNDLAQLCSMSVSTFYRTFKEEQGMAFSDYFTCLRLHVAKLMLRHTNLSVSEVAASVGFCDASHFGKAFRSTVGATPSDYRQRFVKG